MVKSGNYKALTYVFPSGFSHLCVHMARPRYYGHPVAKQEPEPHTDANLGHVF